MTSSWNLDRFVNSVLSGTASPKPTFSWVIFYDKPHLTGILKSLCWKLFSNSDDIAGWLDMRHSAECPIILEDTLLEGSPLKCGGGSSDNGSSLEACSSERFSSLTIYLVSVKSPWMLLAALDPGWTVPQTPVVLPEVAATVSSMSSTTRWLIVVGWITGCDNVSAGCRNSRAC